MIVVAYNEHKQPVSIVFAQSVQLAKVYWSGQSLNYTEATEFGESVLDTSDTGVAELMQTTRVCKYECSDSDNIMVVSSKHY